MDNKKYRYRILKEQNLIIKYYSGKLTLKDLYDFVKLTGEDADYLPTMFVLNDIRDCLIVIDNNEVYNFIENIKNSQRLYAKRKIVFLTKTPNQVVFSTMIDIFKNETFIKLFIATTLDRALRDLMISEFNYDLVNQTLNDLKTIISNSSC